MHVLAPFIAEFFHSFLEPVCSIGKKIKTGENSNLICFFRLPGGN